MSVLPIFRLPVILATLALPAAVPSFAQEAGSASAPIALVGGTVLSSPEADPLPEAVVVIENGKIATVGPRGSVEIPPDASILSIDDHWVAAGFWNAHFHFGGFLGGADTLSDAAVAKVLEMAPTRWGFVCGWGSAQRPERNGRERNPSVSPAASTYSTCGNWSEASCDRSDAMS